MRIAVGSDHRGYSVKENLVQLLKKMEHEVVDCGTHDCNSVDYPDVAAIVARQVHNGEVDRGILICGTGIGMSIAVTSSAPPRPSAFATRRMPASTRHASRSEALSAAKGG